MRHVLPLCVICLPLLLGGCMGGSGPGSHAGEAYMVNAPRTGFYKFGPAQAAGPDFSLAQGERVKMLSRDYGFSNVALENGDSGYVATEDLSPAPPLPKAAPQPAIASSGVGGVHRHSRAPTEEEESEIPPPELPKPQPQTPTFRY